MQPDELIQKAKTEFARVTSAPINGVTGFSRVAGGGIVSLEVLEKKAIPDSMDILGLYEVRLDSDGNFVSFQRKRLRKRGDTSEE